MLAIAVLTCSSHAIDRSHYDELMKKVAERFRAKDWHGAREVLIEVGRELPAPTPRYLLAVASMEARMGHNAEALKWLQKFSATGLSFDLARNDGMKGLLEEEAGRKIAARLLENRKPIAGAGLVCSLPLSDIMPEDITYVRSLRSFVVSSIQHHGLYRVSLPKAGAKDCEMEQLPLPDDARRWPIMAVSFDPTRQSLWVTSSAMPGFSGFPKEDSGKASLFEVDAASGKLLHRFDLASSGPAVLGDMCVTSAGVVYLTDSLGGGVYRLRGDLESAKLEKIADGLFSPQTPALARDGKRLFVADYTMGIAVVDLSAGQPGRVSYLPHPENVAVVGLDGLYLNGDSLIAIQNGTDPMRILRLKLNREQTRITEAKIIEQAGEQMGDPTHAILMDGWFYVSANVGWNQVDDDTGKLKEGASFTPPVLLRFPARTSAGGGK